jgi:hypothetical protein
MGEGWKHNDSKRSECMYEGGCFCGAVRYQSSGPASLETSCHCKVCRRTSGAPFVAWFTVPTASFRITAGTPESFQSSEHAVRAFCSRCGTPLTFQSLRTPEEIDITTCSLDEPEHVPPKDHTWTQSRLRWVKLADDLPMHEQTRQS